MMTKTTTSSALALTLAAVFASLLIASLEMLTRERASASKAAAELSYLGQVLDMDNQPAAFTFVSLPIDNRYLEVLGLGEAAQMHIALRNGEPYAAIVPSVSNTGYGGAIKLLVGIDFSARITAVRIVSHRETKGLGDKIESQQSDWIDSFKRRSLNNPKPSGWAIKADGGIYDQFTGATITPRAVVRQVAATLEVFAAARLTWLADSAPRESLDVEP